MSHNGFARGQLTKHGWTDGQGLGKEEHGIKEAIKVQVKNNKTGIGHDPGAEFSQHWWDDVFNRTASSIHVETTQDGHVKVQRKKKEKKEKHKTRKTALYGNFIKGSTLKQEDGRHVEHREHSSSSEGEEDFQHIDKPSEEELFERCGGRTAHKGARHGLGLSGKLQRINDMEQRLLHEMKTQSGSPKGKRNTEQEEIDVMDNEESPPKKKKKKKKSRDCHGQGSDCDKYHGQGSDCDKFHGQGSDCGKFQSDKTLKRKTKIKREKTNNKTEHN